MRQVSDNRYQREGDDLITRVRIKLPDALSETKVDVPHIDGRILRVPLKEANSLAVLPYECWPCVSPKCFCAGWCTKLPDGWPERKLVTSCIKRMSHRELPVTHLCVHIMPSDVAWKVTC